METCHINKSLFVLTHVIHKLSEYHHPSQPVSKRQSSLPGSRFGSLRSSPEATARSNQQHIPYRDSKLTLLLRASLGGNSLTVIICLISPTLSDFQQSLSTLKFASSAKHKRTRPVLRSRPVAVSPSITSIGMAASAQQHSVVEAGGDDDGQEEPLDFGMLRPTEM